ncbi:SGNH/GDSL hydrolase family protein [Paenibacillus koleovorans]|uniref:SGNH/GDSL hydrolase family protein n=1 Tax=Paenibacillus koleovorans TaxID=121608 RepID=UPI000FDCB736|nr:SGNH/GDSL hydrolase family protein [Paenibacillus koleovorans]
MSKETIICFGDSITQGSSEEIRWTTVLQKKLEERFGEERYTVVNAGIGGNTTANAFDRLEKDVIERLPATVLLEFGINDSNHRPWASVPRVSVLEYEKNMREFHRVIQKRGGRCFFVLNHPLEEPPGFYIQGNGLTFQQNLEPYNEVVRKLSEELEVPVLDLPRGLRERRTPLIQFWTGDGVHLSEYGNAVYADIVFEQLCPLLA